MKCLCAVNMERKRKKDFLDSYHELMLRARCKRLILEQLRDDYESIRGIDYETAGLPRSRGYASDLSGMYARIEEHRRELDATLRQAEGLLRQIQEALEALHDPRAALIISRRHIDRKSWKEIAGDVGLSSESRTREIYVKALDRLKVPI